MVHRTETHPCTRAAVGLAATALLLANSPAPALAQTAGGALAGCWAPETASAGAATRYLCVVPGATGAEVVTVDSGRVVARTPAGATEARRPSSRDGCTGWESARLAAGGERVYLRSEHACPGGLRRASSGLLALGTGGELLDVTAVAVKGASAVRVGRFRAATPTDALPAEVAEVARRSDGLAASTARAAAAAPVSTADVVDVARAVDAAVVEAWLVERRQGFALDARSLAALADAGVPGRVTDMMIALSYPNVFAVNPATGSGELRPAAATAGAAAGAPSGRRVYADMFGAGPFGWNGWNAYSPLGASLYGLGYGLGYGGYGWYPGGAPVIVVRGSTATPGVAAARGRAVNGRGYTRDRDTDGGSTATPRPSTSTGGSAGGSMAGASSGGASGGSREGGGSGRTAKPRP